MLKRFIPLSFLILMLFGCAPTEQVATTRTRSGDEVISTAKALAELTRQATALTPPPTAIPPSPTPEPPTPSPEPTATLGPPIVTANYNAYVRNGPDEAFASIDFFLEGQTADVTGRYENPVTGTWWFIEREGVGVDGWVWSGAVTLSGSDAGVPFVDSPPTPNP
jgi:hypothetical protein